MTHQHAGAVVDGSGDAVFVRRHSSGEARSTRSKVTHTYTALAFCTAGRADTEQGGSFRIERGDVLLVPAGSAHRTVVDRAYEGWGVGFHPASVDAADRGALLAPFERVRAGASPVVRLPSERRTFVETLLAELRGTSAGARLPGHVQRSLLSLIVHEIVRAIGSTAHVAGARGRGVVADSLAVIERRCLARLTLDEVAAAVGRSPSYVTTALRRETGHSALQWITAGRMAEARRLLLHSDAAVDRIARRVGYADATHFIRTFRRTHGITPAAWRAALRASAA